MHHEGTSEQVVEGKDGPAKPLWRFGSPFFR
jgi:hypothetical protein